MPHKSAGNPEGGGAELKGPSGTRPDGSNLKPPMPVWAYARMKPDDVQAIVLYLRSLPPKG